MYGVKGVVALIPQYCKLIKAVSEGTKAVLGLLTLK